MITSDVNYDDEEDVVIAGSELHEALSKMGYSDYEVVSIPNQQPWAVVDGDKSAPKQKSDGWVSQILDKRVFEIYRSMVKDSKTLRQQLTVISKAQHLLDDHADLIKSLLDKHGETKYGTNKFLQYLKYAAVASVGYYLTKRSNQFTWLLTFPALIAARYEYTKWRSTRDLKKLISEQTELYYIYKRALRILSHYFRMNNSAKHLGSKFTDFGSEKVKFLQPITEKMLRSLATMSIAYYETTLRVDKLLPDLYRQNFDYNITAFDRETFTNCGEVTHTSLKQSFYRFILIQSEMLLTLAVLRHSEPNDMREKIIRGMKIDRNVKRLVELTTEHRMSMKKLVDDFHKHKLSPVDNKYRGFPGSKWQDLYVRLHLTSHKMQKAYDNVTSLLEEIENHLDRGTDETELLEMLKIKLDDLCNDTDKAKDLAQLSALIITKMACCNRDKEKTNDENRSVKVSQRDLPIVKDSDPEIIDEVFEEYIRERYSEVLLDKNAFDYLEGNYKLDKLLSKNLMSELKEALVDKEKDTRERESRALKRMNKNSKKETPVDDVSKNCNLSSDSEAVTESTDPRQQLDSKPNIAFIKNGPELDREKFNYVPLPPPPPPPPPPPVPKEFVHLKKELRDGDAEKKEDEEEGDRRRKHFVPLLGSGSISMPLFLPNNEETFIGSGENSDEDVVGLDGESEEEKENDDAPRL